MAVKERRLDVMLSSTSKDLPEHREKATTAASRAGFYVVQMENLTALPQKEDAISVSMAMVEEAEIYVGIFGLRYGYIPKDERNPNEVSITEMEYRRAKELGMPILIFVMSDKHPAPDTSGLTAKAAKEITDAFYERDPRGEEKLDLLKKELTANHIVAFFDSAEDLGLEVQRALHTTSLREAVKVYVEKRDAETPTATSSTPTAPKATIPYPPQLYAYPPYSGQNARFVGRRAELHLLNEWAAPEAKHPLLVLEAIGGMGKSALTWRWVQDNAVPFDGVFWYSFYEGGALMSEFVRHALAYVTRRDPDSLRDLGFGRTLSELVHALQHGRYLLVLDGLERVLVAYHRWNAAQMQDDAVEEGKDYRACTDPRDTDVLRQLASCDTSRILITSRLMPAALGDSGAYLEGVRRVELKGLSPEDARRLWHGGGLTWNDEGRLDGFINQFGRHSLLLKLMIDIIKKNRRANGSFDRWVEANGDRFDPFQDIRTKRHHILEFAYEGLSVEARKLLSQMAALGGAVDIDTLNVFNPYLNMPEVVSEPQEPYISPFDSEERKAQKRTHYEEQKAAYDAYLQLKTHYERSVSFKQAIHQFDAMLQDLEERGLIWWDADNLQYDLHPVVRGYAFGQLAGDDRPTTYDRIYNFFEAQERGKEETRFSSYAEMQNLIAMYNALIGAGKLDEAADLFITRMRFSLLQEGFGLYHKGYELLLPLFPNGLSEMPAVSTTRLQGFALNQMGLTLYYMDRDEEALPVRAANLKVNFEINVVEMMTALRNYGQSLRNVSRLAHSLRCFRSALTLAELVNHQESISYGHYYLIDIHLTLGRWDETKFAYETFVANPPNDNFLIAAHRQFALGLMRQGADRSKIQTLLDKAESLNREQNITLQHRALLTIRGHLALRNSQYDEAINLFAEAARIGYEQGVRDPAAWSGLARAYAAKGDLPQALRIIQDGVDNHGYSAAVVYLANGDHAAAKEAALEFYTWAWAQGEPYVRRWELEQARDILQQLGEPEPQLPVWDEASYVPFEHEGLVIEYIEKLKREREELDKDE